MTSAAAVAPGVDLGLRARQLVRLHDAVMSGSRSLEEPRPVVARSWARMKSLGLDPDRPLHRDILPIDQVEARRAESALALVADRIRAVLTRVADASLFIVVITDRDGVILWREGSPAILRQADSLGFALGAHWSETYVGTNAIGTALAEQAPVQLFSAEHFEHRQHPWYCTAAPVHDPRDGSLLGIVDVSGPAMTMHPALVALVDSAVQLAQGALWQHHEQQLRRLRERASHLIATAGSPLLLVDDHGWVAHREGVSVRDRIAAPRADRPLAVPGLGMCLPERVGDGWLVRPAPEPRRLSARLGRDDTLHLAGGAEDQPWTVPLSRRHAQILRLLAAAPRGMTAAALSTRLYGDGEHEVAVRAEISRLRRAAGALVEAAPYRIADGIDVVCD
ncbi:GAF domain-containing protein [Branchiibius cervicis]|uniref:GAF domain-containing protein n=1 Tax=Branchiibius cervicis TaxID=908252 RepID=A0ABW2AR30_9MICO